MSDLIQPHSTWQDDKGRLWHLDHLADNSFVVMRPDWMGAMATVFEQTVLAEDLLRYWRFIETPSQRFARAKINRRQRCDAGYHEDPDRSGLCIHCGVET